MLGSGPPFCKQLQRFLRFANFYCRFIRGYSKVAVPLTRLTLHPFTWSAEVESAFIQLIKLFTMAPIISHPDPARQFTVVVDASDVGVGAVLSQRHLTKHLNSRQARWVLFLGQFNFTLTNRPGSKNTKPDALSCQFPPDYAEPDVASILSLSSVAGAATWQVEVRLQVRRH